MSLLRVHDLAVAIAGRAILRRVSLAVDSGEIVALVGESGSGKSMLALSVMGLLPHGAVPSGSITLDGDELIGAAEARLRSLRGDDIGMVFQEPMTALNPVRAIGEQVAEGIRLHRPVSRREAMAEAQAALARVGLDPARVPPGRYPHELSGGQRQRVGIAIATALRPRLLIADEPTTALDVTVQAQILDLLARRAREDGMALLLVTHDLGIVAGLADRIVVLRDGEVVEAGGAVEVLRGRRHPYTARLAAASAHCPPRNSPPVLSSDGAARDVLLSVRDLVCAYPRRGRLPFTRGEPFRAVDGVSFDVLAGQTLALVGESGCGKSTLARAILGLKRPDSGSIHLAGTDISDGDQAALLRARRDMQIVFQDPYGSFDPRWPVERIVAEPLHLRPDLPRARRRELAAQALDAVGLGPDALSRYPHEFSGGQRQRIAIARALVVEPKLVIADEPVSALDVSIRAQVLDLLAGLRNRLGLAYLFITHDLGVVRAFADEALVMRAGRIVERGPVEPLFSAPTSPYTAELVAATPDLDAALAARSPAVTDRDGAMERGKAGAPGSGTRDLFPDRSGAARLDHSCSREC